MKLTTRYYSLLVPSVTVLFLGVIIGSYFLIRQTLQTELDSILLRSKSRIETYVRNNKRLPDVTTFNDQLITFRKTDTLMKDSVFCSSTQYIPEQNKNHVSRRLTFTLLLDKQPWEVTINEPLEGTRHLTILIAKIAIAATAITLFLFVLINRSVLSRLWRPFYESLARFDSFKVDDPVYPILPDSKIEEFRLMNAHFLKAAENANRDYRNLKEFSENAAHELQTPLAIVRSNLDLLAQEQMTEKQSELLQSAYSGIRRMSKLQESLLLLTKIDNRQFGHLGDIRVDLALRDKIQQVQELLHAKNLSCHIDLRETSILANRELLDILLNNLYSNAIRHNVVNGDIITTLRPNSLCVSNTGNYEELDGSRIFRRFYKSTHRGETSGLGLSIIKQICDTTAMSVQYAFDNGRHAFIISW